MKKIKVGSDEWKAIRRTKITATDIPIILGVSPWMTKKQLYLNKINAVESRVTKAMKHGSDMEEEAREYFERLTGEFVFPEFITHATKDWIAASFDGINSDGFFVEIKCPKQEGNHWYARSGKVPEEYYPQVMWQMNVAISHFPYIKKGNYFSYRPFDVDGSKVNEDEIHAHLIIERNDEYIKMIEEKAYEFYQCLVNKTPPETTDEDVQIIDDEDFLSKERRLRYLMEEYKKMEENIELVRNQLIEQCNGKKTQGLHLKYSPSFCQGSVEYKSIPQLKGVDLDQFRKPGYTKWRIDLL